MGSVFEGVPQLQGPPDISNVLKMLSDGLAERRARHKEEEQTLLQKSIGGQLATGDTTGAATTAFNAGEVGTGLKIQELSGAHQQQFAQTVAKFAAEAQTPEEWERIRQKLTQMTGSDPGDFETGRKALLAEASTLPEILARQDKAETRSSKAPDVVEIFDPASGQPQKMTWDAAERKFVPLGGAKAPSKGIRVTTNADGSTTTEIGGTAESNQGLTGPTTNVVQAKAFNTAEMGSRLAGIMEKFKPEYQTVGTRLANLWRGTKASIDPKMLSPGDTQSLTDFAKYRSQSIGNVNRLLNELSGAAVSPSEGERLKAEVPNPGTGIFDGDDPVSFKAKMESVADQANRALARYQYYQSHGLPQNLEEIPLNNVKQIGGKWYVKAQDGQVYEVGTPAP